MARNCRAAARGKFFGAGAEAGFAVDRPGHYQQRGAPRDAREIGARFSTNEPEIATCGIKDKRSSDRSTMLSRRLSRARAGWRSLRSEHTALGRGKAVAVDHLAKPPAPPAGSTLIPAWIDGGGIRASAGPSQDSGSASSLTRIMEEKEPRSGAGNRFLGDGLLELGMRGNGRQSAQGASATFAVHAPGRRLRLRLANRRAARSARISAH